MKKLLYVFIILFALTGAALGAASWWIMQKMGPETWVELAEENWNCRAEVGDAKLNLLTRPATFKFINVRLAPRDLEVAKAYADRAPLATGSTIVHIPELTLDVKLDDLLNRRLYVEHVGIINPTVTEIQDDEGKSSLEALFKKPGSTEAVVATPKTEAPPPQVESKASEDPAPAFSYAVSSATIEKGQFNITSGTTRITIQDLDFKLTGIDVDKADLANHNRIQAALSTTIDITGMARIDGAVRPAELAHLVLSGTGDIRPYNPQTLEWQPLSKLSLTLAKGSVLGGHLTIGEAAGKELRKLQEYGVDLAPVVIGGPLMQDTVVTGDFTRDIFINRALARFIFPEYEVAIEPKSWFNASKDRHDIDLRLSTGPVLQERLRNGIAQAKLGESIAQALTKALSDDQGRMTFDIASSGSLSDPKVKPKTDRVLKNLMSGEGLGDLLQGLFKKL
jgi:hypothetical protein